MHVLEGRGRRLCPAPRTIIADDLGHIPATQVLQSTQAQPEFFAASSALKHALGD